MGIGKIRIVKGVLKLKNLISIGVKFGIYYGSKFSIFWSSIKSESKIQKFVK